MIRSWVAIITVLLITAAHAGAADERPPADPVARKTWRARDLQERRAQRTRQAIERTTRPSEPHPPVPLPVQIGGGTPAGAVCETGKRDCQLEMTPPAGQVLVVTALWSAARAVCDGLTLSGTPPNGLPIAPWWRCEQRLTVTGPGAGYAGFLAPK